MPSDGEAFDLSRRYWTQIAALGLAQNSAQAFAQQQQIAAALSLKRRNAFTSAVCP
jgi:hypothetical protein